jgi:hypothetical protein
MAQIVGLGFGRIDGVGTEEEERFRPDDRYGQRRTLVIEEAVGDIVNRAEGANRSDQ